MGIDCGILHYTGNGIFSRRWRSVNDQRLTNGVSLTKIFLGRTFCNDHAIAVIEKRGFLATQERKLKEVEKGAIHKKQVVVLLVEGHIIGGVGDHSPPVEAVFANYALDFRNLGQGIHTKAVSSKGIRLL